MTVTERFGYGVPPYTGLREPSRAVSAAYGEGNKWLDQLKEYVYIEQGMPNLSRLIHNAAHRQLERLDDFGDLLHERRLAQFYPTTQELDLYGEVRDLDGAFALVIRVLEHVQAALLAFRDAAASAGLLPLALRTEELMLRNSGEYAVFLELWSRWDADGGSKTSFDGLCEEYLEEEEEN